MVDAIVARLQEGLQLQRAGRLGEAEACYRRVLSDAPGDTRALNLLGALCVNSKRSGEAARLIESALRLRPADPQAHGNLGLALKDLGRFSDAETHLRESIRLAPNNPVVLNNLGNVLRERKNSEEAIQCFERALQLNPGYAEAWSNLAAAGVDIGKHERALVAADRAVELNPRLAEAWGNRGDILRKLSRFEEAAASYRRAAGLNPGMYPAIVNLADTEKNLGHTEEAQRLLDQVLAKDPGNAMAWHTLGVLKEQLGDREAAAAALCKAVEIAPDLALAHYQLAQLKGRRTTDEELRAREDLYGRADLATEQRFHLAFALGIAYEQRADYERAFQYWSEANRIRAAVYPYDDEQVRTYMQRIRESCHGEASRSPASVSLPVPVFVVGMPRSGTSLTEQILASHPAVAGAGELPYMEATVKMSEQLTGMSFPESCGRLSDEQCAELGHYYLSKHSVTAGMRYVVDKSPMNFQYIGLIARILPQARIIHCRRDPTDTCLSIFQRPFEGTHTYSHDLGALGTYHRHYQRLMEFWHEQLPGRLLDVQYEDTVADVERASRRMLEFLDLPFDEAVLAFHATDRQVRTPSAMQVRQPIYTDSVRAWKRYEAHLAPLLEALQGGPQGPAGTA